MVWRPAFRLVARYILDHRRTGEHYPGYITDIDLSFCRETIAQQTGLQLSHYLQIKTDLEMQLNQAMRQIDWLSSGM
ncbi:adenylate cyclase [Cellvibrio japonicus Ueda107]|uniref:Adenylate cyclase n=1 Tax=Cellvibrio japonicus (strain Ueda107) TaxID=498211 RepID=B3PH72_CELJU|nr:adenylate cyclase [Cellvibrio japonicus Ueda107]